PNEAGNFDTVLVRRAAEKLRDSSARWERYAKAQGSAEVVKPLLVLQAPNTPDADQLGLALDEILRVLPDLSGDSVRHVFGDRTTAGKVAKFLSGAIDELPGGQGKKVLLDGRELRPNEAVPAGVWEVWDRIPTMTLPRRGSRPVKRLVSLAQALSADAVRP